MTYINSYEILKNWEEFSHTLKKRRLYNILVNVPLSTNDDRQNINCNIVNSNKELVKSARNIFTCTNKINNFKYSIRRKGVKMEIKFRVYHKFIDVDDNLLKEKNLIYNGRSRVYPNKINVVSTVKVSKPGR